MPAALDRESATRRKNAGACRRRAVMRRKESIARRQVRSRFMEINGALPKFGHGSSKINHARPKTGHV
jgi:hypothetical protein